MFRNTVKILLSVFSFCLLFACAGEPGNNGVAGNSCTISDNGDGTKTIRCDDGTSAVIQDGRNGFSGATGATGAPGDTGESGEDGEDGENGIDGTDCTVVDNGDGTATITCEDGTTVTIGNSTTSETDAGTSSEDAIDAGMSEEVSDAGMSDASDDAGMSEASSDAGMGEESDDAGMSEETSDAGSAEETTDAGSGEEGSGFSFSYGFEDDDYNAPSVAPATYSESDDVWANVTSLGAVTAASEGSHFWGMQDLDNPNQNGYHIMTFGPYDVSAFWGGTFSFDYFTVGYDAGDTIGFTLLLDDTTLPNLDVSDAALVMLNTNTVGEWTSQSGSFGSDASMVTIVVAASQNGTDDYAGVDNFVLTCDNCQAPSVTSCLAGATLTLPTTTSDGSCTDCAAGTYDDDANDSTACIDHTVTSGDCNAGQLFAEGTVTADGSCTDITCEANQSVTSNACEACAAGTSNEAGDPATGIDTDCDAVACPANSEGTDVASGCTCSAGFSGTIIAATEDPYYTGSCAEEAGCADGTWDDDNNDATDCIAHTACDANAAETAAGTATTDVVCECNAGYYGDGVTCAAHTTCDVNGTETAAGDATTDAICECNAGYFGDGANCTAHTVTDCAAGQTLTVGTATADGSCADCAAGEYDDDSDALTPCIAHTVTDCAAGQTLTAGTTTADGSCADCASGEWDDDGDATTICVAHTVTDCAAGQTLTAGTTTADGSCADCAAGKWDDDGDATTVCVAHTATDCSAVADGSEVAGTITTDTYCGCDENFFAVGDGSCSACTSGTNAAGDDAAGSATTCDE